MKVRHTFTAAVILAVWAVSLYAQSGRSEGRAAFRGFFRYGAWTVYYPAGHTKEPLLEAGGTFRMISDGELLFKPGIFPPDSVLIHRDNMVSEVVKGMSELKQNQRLTLWYGHGMDACSLEYWDAGPFMYVIMDGEIPRRETALQNVDVIVVERYPHAFYPEETSFAVKKWLIGGGTAVITSRAAIRTSLPSVFEQFFSSREGRAVTSRIRKKWERGGTFTPDEYYVIPAGLGRIVFFPTDREETGIKTNFRSRGAAWEEIASLCNIPEFPRGPERYSLAGEVNNLIPVSSEQFNIHGKWVVILLYCIAAVWLALISGGWKKHIFLALVSIGACSIILLFYSPPDFITGSLSLARTEAGRTAVREYSFVKAVSFRSGTLTFSDRSVNPYFPLIPDNSIFEIQASGEAFTHTAGFGSFQSRTLYRRSLAKLQNPVSWSLSEKELTVRHNDNTVQGEMYLFDNGILYRVPGSGTSPYPLSGLTKITASSGTVISALKAGNMLGLCRGTFLFICADGGGFIPEAEQKSLHIHSGTVLFIGKDNG